MFPGYAGTGMFTGPRAQTPVIPWPHLSGALARGPTHPAEALTSLNHGLQQFELLAVGETDRDAKEG